jgi:hypothetical protein
LSLQVFATSIRRMMILGMISYQNQLHSEGSRSPIVTRHSEEDAVGYFRVGPLREADGRVTVAESGLEGGAKLHGIEETSNITFRQMRVRHLLDLVANTFYKTRRKTGWRRDQRPGAAQKTEKKRVRPCCKNIHS